MLLETLSDLKKKLQAEAQSHRQQLNILNEQIKDLKQKGHLLDNEEKLSSLENHENASKNSIKIPTFLNPNDTTSIISETSDQSSIKSPHSEISTEPTTQQSSGDLKPAIPEGNIVFLEIHPKNNENNYKSVFSKL